MFRILCITFMLTSVLVFVSGQAAAATHPSTDQPVNEDLLPVTYGGDSFKSADMNINDIIFSDSSAYPDIADLSHAEKYIMAGVTSSPWKEGVGLQPWSLDIYILLSKYYQNGMSIPDKLGYDEIRSIPGYENMPDERLDVFRNPMTGDWPVMDDASGHAGSVYIHLLTDEEKYHLAIRDEELKKVLYLNSFFTNEPPYREVREPNGPPIYMRVVGQSGKPILEFVWTM